MYSLAEKSSVKEVKQFYTEHSTDVFYVVYGSFTTLETTIQDKRMHASCVVLFSVLTLTHLILYPLQC